MKSFGLLFGIFLILASEGFSQTICFDNYVDKIVIPSKKALETAKTDKKRDSLKYALWDEFKRLVGCEMPDFSAQTLQEEPLSKQVLKGKIVVMNFWFIGCKPCMAELPALNTLVEQYKGKDVVFIAFGRDSKQRVKEVFLPKHAFDFKLVTDGKRYADTFLASVTGFPLTLIFDQQGVLQFTYSGGYIDERAKTAIFNKVSPVIAGLLEKPSKTNQK